MTDISCVCDVCNKTVPVKRIWITKFGKVVFYLQCGHVTGFVFDAKLLKLMLKGG